MLEKPPKLDIIEFNGNREQYPLFFAQIREARQLHSDVKILAHLKTRLKGKAFDAVRASLLSGCTLVDVLSVLGKHFGNPKVVVQTMTKTLFNRPPIKAHDYQELAEFSIEVDNAQAVLRAIGYERELDNIQSMVQLVSKLPAHDADRWAEYGRKWESEHWPSVVSSVEFAKFLASLVEDRQFSRPTALSTSARTAPRRQDVKHPSGARVLSTQEVKQAAPAATSSAPATAVEPRKIRCYYCRGEHVITKCSTFAALSVKECVDWVQREKACNRCFSKGHRPEQCWRERSCKKNGCQEKHHPLLHAAKPAESAVPVGVVCGQEYTVLMKTVCVRVQGPEKAVDCIAYLDEGSAITLMKTSLAEEIGCGGETTPLRILTLNGISEQVAKKVTANIQSSDTSQSFDLNPVYAVEHLPLENPTPVSKNLENQFPELKGYHLPLQSESPSFLIGLDHADLIACREARPLSSNGPYRQKTLFGWSVTSKAILGDDTRKAQLVHRLQPIGVTNDATELSDLVKSSWTTESFGCKYNDDGSKSFEDRKSEEILSREVLHNGTDGSPLYFGETKQSLSRPVFSWLANVLVCSSAVWTRAKQKEQNSQSSATNAWRRC